MKKTLAFLFAIIIIFCSCVSVSGAGESDSVLLNVSQLKAKFPHGKYWNHGSGPINPDVWTDYPCTHHYKTCFQGEFVKRGHCGCNAVENGHIQCHGYVVKLTLDAYGKSINHWDVAYNLNNLKPGDAIRLKNNNHTIWVTAVDGENITYADCNGDNRTCQILWDSQTTKSALSKRLVRVYIAPYLLPEELEETEETEEPKKNTYPPFEEIRDDEKIVICDDVIFMLKEHTAAELLALFGDGISEVYNRNFIDLSGDVPAGSGNTLFNMDSNGDTNEYTLILLGDVNADGAVKLADARNTLRFALSIELANSWQALAADVNYDGKITVDDARRILRGGVGIDNFRCWLNSYSDQNINSEEKINEQ